MSREYPPRGIIRQSTAAVRHLFPDVRQLDCNRFPDRRNGKHCFPAEINTDTASYLTALRAALRQSPDVILLGEMRDYETINTAVTAAETGHMIFSHSTPSVRPIPLTVFCQKLLPSVNGEMILRLRSWCSPCHPQSDPRRKSPPDQRYYLHFCRRKYDCYGQQHLTAL